MEFQTGKSQLPLSNIWDNEQKRRYLYFGLFIYIVLTVFLHNDNLSIWDQDEGAYALFAKNMIETGNWVIPDAQWSIIHRKPPLHFWNIAISFKLFGINHFALRLPAALFSISTLLLTLWAGGRLFDKKTSYIATLILSTSILASLVAKVSVVDSTLLFFMTACAFAMIFTLRQKSWKWTMVFWFSFALAVLTKGPPVIMFTIILAGVLFLFHPNRKNLISLHPWFFLPIALMPFTFWCWLTYLEDGGVFLNWMYDWYILKRINGSVLGQTGMPGTHFIIILVCFSVYFAAIPNAIFQTVKTFFKDKDYAMTLGAWFFAGWFIYELSPSKLPTYVLSAHIPFAFLLAQQLLVKKPVAKIVTGLQVIIHYSIGLAFIILPNFIESEFINSTIFKVLGFTLITLTSLTLFSKKIRSSIAGRMVFGIVFHMILIAVILPQLDQFKDLTKRTSSYIVENYSNDNNILIGNNQWTPPSLPFYLSNHFEKVDIANRNKKIVETYFNSTKERTVLILSEQQLELLKTIIGSVPHKEFTNRAIKKDLLNKYYVVENLNPLNTGEIPVANPKSVLTLERYRESIQKNKDWNQKLLLEAKEKNIKYERLLTQRAKWYQGNRTELYQFDKLMRSKKSWLMVMKEKSILESSTLEKTCKKYATMVINSN